MNEKIFIKKETHIAGNEPTVITTENAVLPVQLGSDIEGEIAAAQHTVKETHIVEKK